MRKTPIRLIITFTLAVLGASFLSACSINPAEQINNSLTENHYTVRSLSYGKLPRQQMDIYRPRVDQGKPPIVFVYGGAWRSGTKTDFKFIGHALTQLGHTVIIPDYQLYPQVKFPVFIEDVAKAIKEAELRSDTLLARPLDEFILMGHSAGAHTAAMLFTDRRYLNDRRVKGRPVALIGLAGPYDLTLEYPEIVGVFDGAGKRSQPIDFIKPGLPPVLLLQGADDKRVLPYHSRTFSEALALSGADVRTRFYPKTNHIMVVGSIAQPLRHINKVYADIAEFLENLQ